MNEDFSKEILETWFDPGKIVTIKLKNGVVLDGVLIAFYHGEENDPYIVNWDFIYEEDFKKLGQPSEISESIKITLRQEDIESIDFKYKKTKP